MFEVACFLWDRLDDDNVNGRWLYMDTWNNGGNYRQSLTGG